MHLDHAERPLPMLIQGGMGVGVSGWRLARAVAVTGQLGAVSGTAIDTVHARVLGDGDPDGHLRRAYAAFPDQGLVQRVLDRWFVEGGRAPGEKYRNVPLGRVDSPAALRELIVLANFGEVWLAKEGHEGMVGVNFLEKIQLPTPDAMYGAMLGGVDVVLMGAGIPAGIPRMLNTLAAGGAIEYTIEVAGSAAGEHHTVRFDPSSLFEGPTPTVARPVFLAIISSNALAAFLLKDPETSPDGFVVEGHVAGGHNAPPRGKLALDDNGEPIYGPRDSVDLPKLAATGVRFWLAGGFDRQQKIADALAAGAAGVQIGTPFALCVESGLLPELRLATIAAARRGELVVRTDPLASPSGYPFKVLELPGTLADAEVYAERDRVCDIGLLRTAFVKADGEVGWRCPAEPVTVYVSKGGAADDTVGRKCLCNGLLATIGLGQQRAEGAEPPIVTIGDDVITVVEALGRDGDTWTAADVVEWVTAATALAPSMMVR